MRYPMDLHRSTGGHGSAIPSRDALWQRAHAILDAGARPSEDEDLLDELAATEPELAASLLDELVHLERGLDRLAPPATAPARDAGTSMPVPQGAGPLGLVRLAIAAGLLAVLAFAPRSGTPAIPTEVAHLQVSPPRTTPRLSESAAGIHSFQFTTTRSTPSTKRPVTRRERSAFRVLSSSRTLLAHPVPLTPASADLAR
ncbi:MAG: hypothetical protein P1V81_11815 [Planctomycetota bacterium]|nr:hypothetical protein [Planctomycetota bacterium]